jgi:hypothetical protein
MFQKHYGGIADDYGSRVLQMDDGGYLVASITESFGAGSRDIYLIRTNVYGDTLWNKTFGGTGSEQPNAMIKTNDGDIIIAGETSSYGAGSTDCYLLKLNQNGDTLWTRTYGGANEDGACDVIQTSDNGFILVGYSSTFTSAFGSVYVVKINSAGDTIWTKSYEKSTANIGSSIIQLADDGYFIVGQTLQPGQLQTSDCYFIRTDAQGDTLWTKTYGGNNYDGAFQCYDCGDGLIISGTTKSFGTGNNDIFLSKFDYYGNSIWYKTYGGINSDYGGSFSLTNDNGYIITGRTESFGAGNQDMYLIKTNSIGDTLWTKTFGGNSTEWGGCVKQTSDNGYIVVGNTNSYGNGYDVYLVKTNADGFSSIDENATSNNSKITVRPNPSIGKTNIQIPQQFGHIKTLEVFDCVGQKQFEKTNDFTDIDISKLTNGLYFIVLTNNENERQIIKIIKE